MNGVTPWREAFNKGVDWKDRFSVIKKSYMRRKAFARGPVLVKCPFSVFSIDYYIDQLDFDVVFSLRNPLDLAATAKDIGTTIDFRELSVSTELINHCFPLLKRLARTCGDANLSPVESMTHYWIFCYTFALKLIRTRRNSDHLHFVSLTQLNQDPVREFGKLFSQMEKSINHLNTNPQSMQAVKSESQKKLKVWTREKSLSILTKREQQYITEKTSQLHREIEKETGLVL
jgi:hypothetical protein